MAATVAPITCHVLNTLSGTPAADLPAILTLLDSSSSSQTTEPVSFAAMTDSDGRVKAWEAAAAAASDNAVPSLDETLAKFEPGQRVPFSIRFAIGPWYEAQGVECFWPEVEVKFYVKKGERHYHVPVLVGPWTYTTYRGS